MSRCAFRLLSTFFRLVCECYTAGRWLRPAMTSLHSAAPPRGQARGRAHRQILVAALVRGTSMRARASPRLLRPTSSSCRADRHACSQRSLSWDKTTFVTWNSAHPPAGRASPTRYPPGGPAGWGRRRFYQVLLVSPSAVFLDGRRGPRSSPAVPAHGGRLVPGAGGDGTLDGLGNGVAEVGPAGRGGQTGFDRPTAGRIGGGRAQAEAAEGMPPIKDLGAWAALAGLGGDLGGPGWRYCRGRCPPARPASGSCSCTAAPEALAEVVEARYPAIWSAAEHENVESARVVALQCAEGAVLQRALEAERNHWMNGSPA